MRFPTIWYVRPAKASNQPARTRSRIRAVDSVTVKLLSEHHLEFLSLKGGCTDSFESTLVNMPHCWKSYVAAQIYLLFGAGKSL